MNAFDDDTPAGYRDADLEQAHYEAMGRTLARLQKRGICAHGWTQGPPGKPVLTCLDCGATFADAAEHQATRDEVLEGIV